MDNSKIVMVGLLAGLLSACGQPPSAPAQSSDASVADSASAAAPTPPPPPALTFPPEEAKFVASQAEHLAAYQNAANDIGKTAAEDIWTKDECKILAAPNFRSWIGTLTRILPQDSGGVGLSIDIGKTPDDDVAVLTVQNATDSLVAQGTPLYAKIATIKEGTKVRFSGEFAREDDGCFPLMTTTVNLAEYNLVHRNYAELVSPLLRATITDLDPIK